MKIWHGFLLGTFALLVSFGLTSVVTAEYSVPAPTIIEVELRSDLLARPLVKGVTFNNTLVDVYIDGALSGSAKVVNGEQGVASFAFEPNIDLSAGQHQVYTVAKSLDGNVASIDSAQVRFTVAHPTPAPILFDPILDEAGKLTIVGLAKNDLQVQIFIEGVLQVAFVPPAAKSGTTNFWYKPNLPAGEYTVTARTADLTGKLSIFSQSIVLNVPRGDELVEKTVDESEKIAPADSDQMETEPISQSDEFEETTVAELEEKMSDQPAITQAEDGAEIVIDTGSAEEGQVVVESPEDIGEIVLDVPGQDMDIVATDNQTKETVEESGGDKVVFEMTAESDNVGPEAAEEVNQTDTAGQIQQRNRITGFIILLVIAVVLAIWYVREKKQADTLEAQEEKDSKK